MLNAAQIRVTRGSKYPDPTRRSIRNGKVAKLITSWTCIHCYVHICCRINVQPRMRHTNSISIDMYTFSLVVDQSSTDAYQTTPLCSQISCIPIIVLEPMKESLAVFTSSAHPFLPRCMQSVTAVWKLLGQSYKAFIGLTIGAKIIGGGDPFCLKFWVKVTALVRNLNN